MSLSELTRILCFVPGKNKDTGTVRYIQIQKFAFRTILVFFKRLELEFSAKQKKRKWHGFDYAP